jgi:hypothetical protein
MLLATTGLVVVAAAILVYARITKRPTPWRPLVLAANSWGILYAALLLGSSLASDERVLDVAQDKKFCGFYLDCHMQVAVTGVDTVREIGLRRANGVFYVVTLRVSSSAVRARLNLIAPKLTIRDSAGRSYDQLPTSSGREVLSREIGPEESFNSTVVFDVPEDATGLRLHVSMGFWVDRLIEAVLIGDEDSILHKRTTFRIAA